MNLERTRSYTPNSQGALLDAMESAREIYPDDTEPSNVTGYIDYLDARKNSPSQEFDQIKFSPRVGRGSHPRLRIGVFDLWDTTALFDLFDKDGGLLVPRDTPVLDLHIPYIHFTNPSDRVTPQTVTESLNVVAKYTEDFLTDEAFIIGLTHPKFALGARRWGFEISEHPLPPEVYEVLDHGQQRYPSTDIAMLSNEVLAFQTRQAFLNRFLPQPSGQ